MYLCVFCLYISVWIKSVYFCVYRSVRIRISVCIYIYVCFIYACLLTCIYMYVYVCMIVYAYWRFEIGSLCLLGLGPYASSEVCVYIHLSVLCIYMCICICVRTCKYTCAHVYMYIM